MNRKQYEIDNLPTQIVIGHQTETGVTSIYFDCTSWLASWPDLVLGVWATQPGGTAAYPAATHMEGDVLVWDVTDSDTAVPGVGTVEIVGITTGKKKLSAIAKTQIMCTTTGTTTTPPEGAKAWVDNVMQAASDAETSKTQAATYAEDAEASAKKAEENAKSVTWETLAGKPSAFPPETHGHAMSEVDGLPDALSQLKNDKLDKTGTAADSNKLGGKAPEYYIQPRNLLDNSDFTNPVNQRGQTGYSGSVYTIDRWFLWSANSNATLSTDGNIVAINPNGDDKVALTQRFAKGYLSEEKSYTFAYLDTQGTIHIDNNPVKYVVEAYDYVEIKRDALTGIIWAALYEGAYTADSLPPYVPKGYAAELAECQRYHVPVIDTWLTGFFKRGQGIVVEIPAARNIRSSDPTVVLNNPKIYTDSGWNDLTFAGVSVNRGYAVNVVFESAAPLMYGQAYIINGIESINMDL